MATVTASTISVNSGSTSSLDVPGVGGSVTINLASHSLFVCNSTKKAAILNKVDIAITESSEGINTKTIYLAKDIHKMMMCQTAIGSSLDSLDDRTTIAQMLVAASGSIQLSCFMPYQNTAAGSYSSSNLSALNMNKVCKLYGDIKVGLKLTYIDGTEKTKYAPVDSIDGEPIDWSLSTATATRIASANTISDTVSVTPDASAKYFYVDDFLSGCKGTALITLFGLTMSNIDPSSTITLTPFLYIGPDISLGTTPPASIAYITNSSGATLTFSSKRVDATAVSTLSITNADATNNNGLSTTDNYGWVGEYDSGVTTDTSIVVNVTIA